MAEIGTMRVKSGLAEMLKGGVIMDVVTAEHARIAEEAVTIPVMAKARIGHFVEAQVLEALEVDYIDESEVLTPADTAHHIDKWKFTVPFVCGCTNQGEAGTGDIVNAVTHMRAVFGGIRRLGSLAEEELYSEAKSLQAPLDLVRWVAEHGRLPVVTFTA